MFHGRKSSRRRRLLRPHEIHRRTVRVGLHRGGVARRVRYVQSSFAGLRTHRRYLHVSHDQRGLFGRRRAEIGPDQGFPPRFRTDREAMPRMPHSPAGERRGYAGIVAHRKGQGVVQGRTFASRDARGGRAAVRGIRAATVQRAARGAFPSAPRPIEAGTRGAVPRRVSESHDTHERLSEHRGDRPGQRDDRRGILRHESDQRPREFGHGVRCRGCGDVVDGAAHRRGMHELPEREYYEKEGRAEARGDRDDQRGVERYGGARLHHQGHGRSRETHEQDRFLSSSPRIASLRRRHGTGGRYALRRTRYQSGR
mmetsp:Transcript_14070/g.41246  ORF Transcript_14070/g.41246 Transcript_14070/m.41246 type:complete len:312 (+) Transcript_14070:216-1151(+)